MIKIIKMGLGGVSKKLWLNIFLLMEVIVIIVASNVMVCNVNSKAVLYEPFKYLLNKQGFIYSSDPVRDDNEDNALKSFKKIEKKLKGEFTSHRVYRKSSLIKINENRTLDVSVHGFETEFYENMHIPLSEGSWDVLSEEGEYIECVICPNKFGVGVGSILSEKNKSKGRSVKYKVVGVLSNPTYQPTSDYMSNGCSTFFENYDVNNETLDNPNLFMYVNGKKLTENTNASVGYGEFVTYDKPVGKDIIKYNNTVLGRKGEYYSTEEFKKNSEDYILKIQRKIMPVFVGMMFIVMIGIISASMIQTMSQMRQYGVFYLCGASRIKCILISIIGNLLTYIISSVIAVCILAVMYNSKLRISIGMIFKMNNIWITVAVMGMLVVMSVIVPFIMLCVSSIKNILIQNEE